MQKTYRMAIFTLVLALFVVSLAGAAQATTLDIWHIYVSNHQSRPIIDSAIARFEADYPDVTINSVPVVNDEYKTKLMIAMGAGDEPDMFLSWGGGPLKEYIDGGKVYDMEDLLTSTGLVDNFMEVTLGPAMFYDGIYGIPFNNVVGAAVWYRTDIFERFGLTPPATWEELVEVGEVLNDNGISPFTLANQNKWTGSMYFMYLVDRIGGPEAFYNAANRVNGGAFNSEAFVKAGEMLQELVDLKMFPAGFNGMNEDIGQSRTLLYTGRAAMYLMGSWTSATMYSENPEILDVIDFFLFPEVEGGFGDPTNMVGTPGNNYFSIANSSENKELAVEFLQYLTDETSANMLAEANHIPPYVGGGDLVEDPVMRKLFGFLEEADSVQLWYDQYLPPELASAHLDTTQALFGKTMTPQEAADTMEAAVQRYYEE